MLLLRVATSADQQIPSSNARLAKPRIPAPLARSSALVSIFRKGREPPVNGRSVSICVETGRQKSRLVAMGVRCLVGLDLYPLLA